FIRDFWYPPLRFPSINRWEYGARTDSYVRRQLPLCLPGSIPSRPSAAPEDPAVGRRVGRAERRRRKGATNMTTSGKVLFSGTACLLVLLFAGCGVSTGPQ